MKRLLVTYLSLCAALSSWAQLFNNGADFHVEDGGVVVVKTMDFINDGQVTHGGYLLVDNTIENNRFWTCDPADSSTVELGLHWFNNDSFASGVGVFNFIGDDQTIGGDLPSGFHDLVLLGKAFAVKSMENHAYVTRNLNLNDAELATNSSTMLMTKESNPIKYQRGFVSTQIRGRLNRNIDNTNFSEHVFPLGHNDNGKIVYRPINLFESDTGTFRTAFIYEDATVYGMDVNVMDDSLCTVNDEFFHIVGSSPNSVVDYEIHAGNDDSWSKLADWDGQWNRINRSSRVPAANGFAYATQKYANDTDRAVVFATEKPFVSIAEKTHYVPFKESIKLEPDYYIPSTASITWTPPEDLDCDDCPTPIYTAGEPRQYLVEVDNGAGCYASDTVRIWVIRGKDTPILIPNAFSPNGDQLNDVFRPYLYSFEKLDKLSIYNRWGEKIYEGAEGWDGTYMGKPVQMGAYIYLAEIKELRKGGRFMKNYVSGTVSVIK